MATTSRPISELVLGFRDTAGAVVASGKVRFYQPGTLVSQTVYSDPACTSAITQPYTLNSVGQGTVYTLEAVRMIVKDSTETTTYYDDVPNLNRHDAVYITSPYFNSGAETTLENVLASIGTNLGVDGKWLESVGATAIPYATVLGQLCVPVTAFGAVGDGTTDDTTAVQAASDRVKARGGGWVFFPKGTYRINSAITIDTAGVNWCGAGPGIAVIKNYGTTTNAITVNVAGTCRNTFRDFSITCNTTSSGAGVSFTSGNFPVIENVAVALHRTGIAMASVTDGTMRSIFIESTDDNAAGVGISLGTRCRLSDSKVNCGTSNGTGINASGDFVRVVDCHTNNWASAVVLSGTAVQAIGCHVSGSTTAYTVSGTEAQVKDSHALSPTTGFSLTGTRVKAGGCTVSGATTGYSLGAANAGVMNSEATTCTTGFSVGAFASCKVVGCDSSSTTDLSVNASATLLIEHSNTFSALSDSATTPHSWLSNRAKVARVTKVSTGGTTPAFTPTPQTCDIYICDATAATTSITINATSTTGLVDGQLFTIIINRSGGSNTFSPTMNAQYLNMTTFIAGGGTQDAWVFPFIWRSGTASWNLLFMMSAAIDPINTSNIW